MQGGDILGTVQETSVMEHRIMVPYGAEGTIKEIKTGALHCSWRPSVFWTATAKPLKLPMMQRWPVRDGRPYKNKLLPQPAPVLPASVSLIPCSPSPRAARHAVPGPFGSGKTVIQHQLAKWSDADLVVYIGCGERGNEMTDVLREFPELVDPTHR